ncbi:MAG: glycosyltransferase family 1 protein, partial [Chitinophagales bacterium]
MKIAVNTRFLLSGQLEGIGWFTHETLKRITRNHPEHEFIFFFDRPYSQEFIFSDNITPIVLYPPARHPLLFYVWFEWSVKNALKKHKADAFISSDGFMSLSTDVPTLLVIHDLAFEHFPEHINWWDRKYYRYFMPKFAKAAKRIATVSNYSKQDIVKHYGVSENKIDVVYNGVNDKFKIDNASNHSTKIEQSYFLFAGAIQPRKNLGNILRAFDSFKAKTNAPILLIVAGRKAWRYEQDLLVWENMQFKDDVQFIDHQTPQQLSVLMQNALALVYVSLFEGFGIPIIEAMRCKTPVITSKTSSMPEVAGDAGLLCNPNKPAEIADAMTRIYENPELR